MKKEQANDVALRPRSLLALCAGYGGLERAVALALPGVQLVGAVERQAYAAAVLGDRMEEGAVDPCPIWDDLESFDGRAYRGRVDIVAAGIPCQGASSAGKRLGVEDERWLWPEAWRITRDCGARWLFIENVAGLLSVNGGAAFAEILGDLGACGWVAEWDCVPARAVGAPHIRDRVFLLAASPDAGSSRSQGSGHAEQGRWAKPRRSRGKRPALGDNREACEDGYHPDADDAGCASERRRRKLDAGERTQRGRDVDGRGSARSEHAVARIGRVLELGVAHWDWWRAPEPCLRGVDDGAPAGLGDDPTRPDQLHLLGNGVVEQAAAIAFAILWDRLHGGAALAPDAATEG